MSPSKEQKSPKKTSKLANCFACLKKPDPEDDPDGAPDGATREVIADQPMATPPPFSPVKSPFKSNVVSPIDEHKNGLKTTPNEAREEVPSILESLSHANPKVSRNESSLSSCSGKTAIEQLIEIRRNTAQLDRELARDQALSEESDAEADFATDETSSQMSKENNGMADNLLEEVQTVKKVVDELKEEPKASSQEPTEAQEAIKVKTEEDPKSPKKEDPKSPKKEEEEAKEPAQNPKAFRESSQEPKASRESSTEPEENEIPDDVTTLDEVQKLNEIIDGEKYDLKHAFFDKISIFYGDITKIQVDAIVNAANAPLSGGGGVDGAIHRAAGYNQLQTECKKHDRPVATGGAVMTTACKLSTHVKNIIHCVGPICYGGVTNERRKKLLSCYRRAIHLAEENGLRSIAFCCISTGIYGYDNADAARTVIKFLHKHFSKKENVEKWDRVVLCLFMDIDKKCYKHYIQKLVLDPTFFDGDEEESSDEEEEDDDKKKKEKKEDEGKEKKEDGEEKKEDKADEKDRKDEEMEEAKPSKKSEAKEEDNTVEKMEDAESQTEKTTVNGGEDKKEEAAAAITSPSTTSTSEKMDKEAGDGEKPEGENENNEADGKVKNEDGVHSLKRAVSEEESEQPPVKRDKPERESAV